MKCRLTSAKRSGSPQRSASERKKFTRNKAKNASRESMPKPNSRFVSSNSCHEASRVCTKVPSRSKRMARIGTSLPGRRVERVELRQLEEVLDFAVAGTFVTLPGRKHV